MTIIPATIPNATCDAMNQYQSMWLASRGFRRPRIVYNNPDHNGGAINQPSTMQKLFGGAAAGAGIGGSFGGPVGAGIGAVGGGLLGLL